MPIRFLNDAGYQPHPDYPVDLSTTEPIAVSGAMNLDGGIYAWVELPAVRGGVAEALFGADPVPRQFKVPVRELRPGPTLGPRDADVMAWLARFDGWVEAVAVAEERWIARTAPEEYARVQARVAEKRAEIAKLDAQDAAAKPSLLHELFGPFGELIEDIKDSAKKIGRVIKWSVVGIGAVVGVVVVARVVKAVRKS